MNAAAKPPQESRLVSPTPMVGDDAAIRPSYLTDFVGQEAVRDNLRVFVEAARGRGEALDHVLLTGPPRPWQKPPSPISSPAKWGWGFARRRGR